ncbi:hypothetical protein A0H81_06231 [Grifola frondosa]|uniref:MACPF domain-containing protein n=1 Tax=Grifola frondosa TaxID=5627 RepID=A0A1C7MBD5_GRIFR|nr:hypothetical protein A0H81_06231 [Grifola frondosa]
MDRLGRRWGKRGGRRRCDVGDQPHRKQIHQYGDRQRWHNAAQPSIHSRIRPLRKMYSNDSETSFDAILVGPTTISPARIVHGLSCIHSLKLGRPMSAPISTVFWTVIWALATGCNLLTYRSMQKSLLPHLSHESEYSYPIYKARLSKWPNVDAMNQNTSAIITFGNQTLTEINVSHEHIAFSATPPNCPFSCTLRIKIVFSMSTDFSNFDPRDIPVNTIPCLTSLGATYNVLTGLYADARSCKQVVLDWGNATYHDLAFGSNGKVWAIPDSINFQSYVNTIFMSNHGESTEDYTKSLSSRTELGASYPFFSGSVSVDYSSEETSNVANSFTRVMHNVNLYTLSLPLPDRLRSLLSPWFQKDLDEKDPAALFDQYGTHLVNSLTAGGRASFTYATDSRKYSSSESVEVAAQLTVKFLMGQLSAEEQVKYKETISSFQTSSKHKILTQGGAPQYGNDSFLSHISDWARSVEDYTAFVDFGSTPAFVPLWQLASTAGRQNVLRDAYDRYCRDFVPEIQIKGPYLHVTPVRCLDASGVLITLEGNGIGSFITFPPAVDNLCYVSQPWGRESPTTYAGAAVSELVPGVLAPVVKWEKVATSASISAIWRGYGPSEDYVVLSNVCAVGFNDVPPANLRQLYSSTPSGAVWEIHEAKADKPINGMTVASPWKFTGSGVKPLESPFVVNMDEVVVAPKLAVALGEGPKLLSADVGKEEEKEKGAVDA